MSDPPQGRVWPNLFRGMAEASQSPRLILVALALTGLAASMTLVREATPALGVELTAGGGLRYPAGVFRSSHPTILAPGASRSDRSRIVSPPA